jgi:hypothetical protein
MRAGRRAVSGLAAGALALGMAAGLAGTADAAGAAPAKVRKVPCRSWTFDVTYNGGHRACYEGVGLLRVRLPRVRRITTGENAGFFSLQGTNPPSAISVHFRPHETFVPTRPSTELRVIDITRR